MATYICGIAASSAVDSSGESIDIAGLDISSLVGSVFNFEHKSEKTSDYVGKILIAKKIFNADDCSNLIELKYWNKCQLSFLYVMGTLFDDYQPAAKEVAAIFKFDSEHPDLPPTLGFSIEGSKQAKEGHVITHSIARKLTITATPANKTCLANKIETNTSHVDPLLDFFKSESVEIELFNEETLEKSMNMHPKVPSMPKPGLKQAPNDPGKQIGSTKSGQAVMSHQKVHAYTGWNAEDHRNAAILHGQAAEQANTGKNSKLADHHNQKVKLHNQAAAGIERKANRFTNAVKTHSAKAAASQILGKALDAGSGLSASGNKTQGAALQKEDIKMPKKAFVAEHKKLLNTLKHPTKSKIKEELNEQSKELKEELGKNEPIQKLPKQGEVLMKPYQSKAQERWAHTENGKEALGGESAVHEWDEATKGKKLPEHKKKLKKSEWLERADEEYSMWSKREEFRVFMKSRMPNLTMVEIDTFGKSIALKKSLDAQKSLETMVGMYKSEESHAPKYGETKPHLDHKSMMKLPASDHHRLESHHQEHAFAAEDKGDHENASKHKDAAAMHMNYSVAVSKPQKSPYAPKGSGQLKNDREQKKMRTGYAEQYHNKLSKSDEPKHKVGDKVSFPVEEMHGKRSDYRKGTVAEVRRKGSFAGMGQPPHDKHLYHVRLDEEHPNKVRHAVGDKYFVPEEHLKDHKD